MSSAIKSLSSSISFLSVFNWYKLTFFFYIFQLLIFFFTHFSGKIIQNCLNFTRRELPRREETWLFLSYRKTQMRATWGAALVPSQCREQLPVDPEVGTQTVAPLGPCHSGTPRKSPLELRAALLQPFQTLLQLKEMVPSSGHVPATK